ncbi:hypothetical protein Tco_1100386 [Tanacetum coccineum]
MRKLVLQVLCLLGLAVGSTTLALSTRLVYKAIVPQVQHQGLSRFEIQLVVLVKALARDTNDLLISGDDGVVLCQLIHTDDNVEVAKFYGH